MRRREFIALAGAAVARPFAACAQQAAMPVVGFLRSNSRAASMDLESAFRDGLGSMGFVEGRNVTIDYQYAENQNDRLPAMAAELVQHQVAVIYAGDNAPAIAAKAATSAIPIVFRIGGDPVKLGLVTNLNRPGSNMTGVSFLSTLTVAIKLQILHEAVPSASVIGLLVNPSNPSAEADTNEARDAARKLGLELQVVEARNAQEIDAAFVTLLKRPSQALVIDETRCLAPGVNKSPPLLCVMPCPQYTSREIFPTPADS